MRQDVAAARERDPAARGSAEIVLCYPGVHALWGYRVARWFWERELKLAGRFCSSVTRVFTGVDIHPGAKLGPGLFIDHATGVVIGETAEVGSGVTIYHGVTLGGSSLERGKRHPTIGDRVTIGAGAKILGPIEVGHDSRIGANAVVVKAVPPHSVVVGVPGQVIKRRHPAPDSGAAARPDLDHGNVPDLVGISLRALLERIEVLEAKVGAGANSDGMHQHSRGADDEVWYQEDFSI